eukprot:s3290_g5.t1
MFRGNVPRSRHASQTSHCATKNVEIQIALNKRKGANAPGSQNLEHPEAALSDDHLLIRELIHINPFSSYTDV